MTTGAESKRGGGYQRFPNYNACESLGVAFAALDASKELSVLN